MMRKKRKILVLLGVAFAATVLGACSKGSGGTPPTPPPKVEELVDFVVDVETGRDIRILQLTDTQIIDPAQKRYADRIPATYSLTESQLYDTCYRYIEQAIEKTNPDLIMLTGDIVYGEFDDDGHILEGLVAYIDSFDIPWAPVYGNHDNESAKGVTWQNQQFIDAENCLFKKGTVTGNGNYTIGITQGDTLVKVIYMMDSNGCGAAFGDSWEEGGETVTIECNQGENIKTTAGFAQDQIDWLSDTASAITEATNGAVSSMIAFHIPIAEFADAVYAAGYQEDNAFANSETYEIGVDIVAQNGDCGYKGEQFKGIHYEYGLWDIFKAHNFDGVFCGHSHNNSISVLYDGVRLTFGLKTGTHDRHIKERLGGTLITMEGNGKFTVEHQYYEVDLKGVNYDFSSADDGDIKAVTAYSSGIIDGIVEDSTATDGYALKGTSITNSSASGIKIEFDNVDLSQYGSVKVRARIEGNAMGFYVNDVYVVWCNSTAYASYQDIDVVSCIADTNGLAGTKELSSIAFGRSMLGGQVVYIDSITFTEKAEGGETPDDGGDDNTGDDNTGGNTQPTYVDPSFGTKVDDTYTYISDFNDSGVTQLVENAYINAWGTANDSITMTVGQGAVANGTGLTLQGAANNVSAEFNLTSDFDLTNVDKLVIDFNYSGWHGNSLYNYVFITIGSTRVNVMPYATFYYGDDLSTAEAVTSSNGATDYFQYNNMYGFIVVDVQAMLANADFVSAFGSGKAIDGFVFGYNGGNGEKTYCVDAVYYSNITVE